MLSRYFLNLLLLLDVRALSLWRTKIARKDVIALEKKDLFALYPKILRCFRAYGQTFVEDLVALQKPRTVSLGRITGWAVALSAKLVSAQYAPVSAVLIYQPGHPYRNRILQSTDSALFIVVSLFDGALIVWTLDVAVCFWNHTTCIRIFPPKVDRTHDHADLMETSPSRFLI